jgi:type VI secretion system secreted protein Hcp
VALDAFLKVKGIPGESADAEHKDAIEVLGYRLDMTAPTDVATGAASGRARLSPLSILKVVDKASALLAKACGTNELLDEVTLELCRATGKKEKYLEYKLSKARVSAIHAAKQPETDHGLPLEDVSFAYAKITWTYFTTDLKTGKPKGSLEYQHDWSANQ